MPDPQRVHRSRLDFARQASAPAVPPAGAERFYINASGALRQLSADGTDAAAGGGEGGVTQQDIDDAIAAVVGGAPGALNTLDELAAALGDDASLATTITNALAGKQPLDEDLTAIAALTTTAFGRALLALADASALRSAHTHTFEGVRAASSADTVCTTNTFTAVALAAADTVDTNAYHDPASQNSRVVAKATGFFKVYARFNWRNSTNAAVRYGQIYKNGAGYGQVIGANAGSASDNDPSHVIVDLVPVVATDYVELMAYQNTGGDLNTTSAIVLVEFIPA